MTGLSAGEWAIGMDQARAMAARINAAFTLGDVAQIAGLAGSSRDGWDCPSCEGSQTLVEHGDHKAGQCRVCGDEFNAITLIMRAKSCSIMMALGVLYANLPDDRGRS